VVTPATAAFRARVNGTPPRNVLAEAAAEPFRDREAATRRRAAIDILRRHDLEDVITGASSGVIFDANMGVVEPQRDVAQRAALDRRYEAARSEREAAERNRAIEQYRQAWDERMRARGWDQRTSSRSSVQRADDAERRRYERACAEIGQPADNQVRYR
jgi:hypothetical protein